MSPARHRKPYTRANAYYRYVRTDSSNGDLNDDSFGEDLYDLWDDDVAALTAAGYTGFPTTGNATTEPFPFWLCLAQVLQNDDGWRPLRDLHWRYHPHSRINKTATASPD